MHEAGSGRPVPGELGLISCWAGGFEDGGKPTNSQSTLSETGSLLWDVFLLEANAFRVRLRSFFLMLFIVGTLDPDSEIHIL